MMTTGSKREVCVCDYVCVTCDVFFIVNKIEMIFQLYGVCMCQQSEIYYSYVVVVVVVSWCV